MNSNVHLHRKGSGFTIIELVVVIAVIAILATLSTLGLARYQSTARDAHRASNVTSIVDALEKYYDQNGEYPSCSLVTQTGPGVKSDVLTGIDQSILLVPGAASGATNSIQCSTLSTSGTDFFQYEGDGSVECASGSSCLSFKLKYRDETNGNIKEVASRRNTQIDTSGRVGTPTLTAFQFSSMKASWQSIDNAISYTAQISQSSSFPAGSTTEVTVATTTTTFTNLSPGTLYNVRVVANAQIGQGTWSPVKNISTPHIATPNPTISSSNPTTVTLSWGAISGNTQYVIQRSTSNTFPVGATTTQWTQTGTSKVFSDSSPSTTHYFRVMATAPDDQSSWSTTDSILPIVPPPTAIPSVSAAMSGTNAVGTTSTTCTYGTPQYSLQYHSENTATNGAWSAYTAFSGTATQTVAASQGYRYVFQSRAQCLYLGASSTIVTSTATPSTFRAIATPAAPTFTAPTSWTQGTYYTVNYTSYCPAGTTLTIGPSYSGGWLADGFDPNDGVNYTGTWGSNDRWTFPSGYGSGSTVRYFTNYRCSTVYSTSPNSPITTTTVTVR